MLLMDIGDAMAIYFSSFLSTMILSKIFLKEREVIYKILCGVMILAGIILVLKPSSQIYHSKIIIHHPKQVVDTVEI